MPRPLTFRLYSTKSVTTSFRRLIASAERRRTKRRGNEIAEKLLHHLVGAKLSLILPNAPASHGAAVSDSSSERDGDFVFEDIVIHVTTAPGEAVIRKCQRNLGNGKRPILITVYKKVPVAEGLAEDFGIGDRIDVFDIEQFLASNLYELGLFAPVGRKETAAKLIDAYNAIIDSCETNPSLKIAIGEK